MAEYEDGPYVVIERRSGGVGTFLWGALLGAGVALLFAPRSGRETRQEIQDGVRRFKETAEGTLRQVQETVTETLDDVRREVGERVQSARDAVEAGREAARETRADMERRIRQTYETFRTGPEDGGGHVAGEPEPGPAPDTEENPS